MNTHLARVEGFVPLDCAGVLALVRSRPNLSDKVGAGNVAAEEIGDGNLNQVFVVRAADAPDSGIIVKQALPYLRVAGKGWPLTRERMRFETQSLLLYNELVPDLSPVVHDHDHDQSWIAMEFLGQHRVMRQGVIDGDLPSGVGAELGHFIAALTHATSEMSLDAPTKKARSIEFSNPALCQLQEQFVYTNPYFESPENVVNPHLVDDVRSVRGDRGLKAAIAMAKTQYMSMPQALLHGDLHTGSIMVSTSPSGDHAAPKVIDPEFAFYGPVGYDVGTLLANLAIGVLAHQELTPEPADRAHRQRVLIDIMRDVWCGFADELTQRWQLSSSGDLAPNAYWGDDTTGFAEFRDATITSIGKDAGGHGGCELLRRCMGIVSVAELDAIAEPEARARVERSVIAVARRWLLAEAPRRVEPAGAVDHLLDAVEAEADAAALRRQST